MRKTLLEFYSRELGYLKQTLSFPEKVKDEEAARLAANRLKDFIEHNEIPDGLAKALAKMDVKAKLGGEPAAGYEKVEMMEADWPEVFAEFGKWVRRNGLFSYVDSDNYPTWDLYDGCTMLKDQWLVSFTDEPWLTAKKGFQGGYEEDTIGYGSTRNEGPGYNIAYTLSDVKRSRMADDGKKAVVFRSSGIRTEHTGANIYQALFWGPDAKDIVPIHLENGEWVAQDWKTDRTLFKSEDISDTAAWVATNFSQYAKTLRP